MNNITIYAIVEGQTEKLFIDVVLAPYLATKNIFMQATTLKKPGQKGGDVKFSRAKNDIRNFLRQRPDTFVTTFIDLYGIKEWPRKELPYNLTSEEKADHINGQTIIEITELCDEFNINNNRFIPYIAIHEFEEMLFSACQILADKLDVPKSILDSILLECGSPENINNSPQTSPSKRLDELTPRGKFPKTTTGITVAKKIGIEKIRKKCPVFNKWIERIEQLDRL